MQHIADIRKEYIFQTLSEHEVAGKPIDQFETWWKQALESDIEEVNAMTLATVAANGRPSARIVLLKGFDENGFVFFTNYQSHKGSDIANNPYVSLVFFWKELERQVRINGRAEKKVMYIFIHAPMPVRSVPGLRRKVL
jgi:pyridoxamine 5'-phosphate oxidase